jgi:hypothetical protein
LQVQGIEQAVCQGRVWLVFDDVIAVTNGDRLFVTGFAFRNAGKSASGFRRAPESGHF